MKVLNDNKKVYTLPNLKIIGKVSVKTMAKSAPLGDGPGQTNSQS